MNPADVVKQLWNAHRIFVNAIDHPVVQGVRVTPGLPTSVAEIDLLVSAIRSIATAER
jgi:selenocysteine lyase/cysteine desulfurase